MTFISKLDSSASTSYRHFDSFKCLTVVVVVVVAVVVVVFVVVFFWGGAGGSC